MYNKNYHTAAKGFYWKLTKNHTSPVDQFWLLITTMLQCGHSNWDTLEEDCPITMFSGNKRPSSFFFVNWPITFKAQLHNCWKLSNPLQFMNFIGLFAKNLKIICFRKCCDWAIFFQVTWSECPHCQFVHKKKRSVPVQFLYTWNM